MKKKAFGLLLAMVVSVSCLAQTERPWERYFNELGVMEDMESASWESVYELLSELEEHPLNINAATREDLERFPFLTAQQVEDICAYLYQYGSMQTLGELAMIESLDYDTRQLLSLFVCAEPVEKRTFPSLKDLAKYGKHELMLTGKIPFYERRGDEEGYLGYKYKHSFRYTYSYKEYVKAGLVGAQDAGEPFFGTHNKWGYDHYSFYVLVQKLGRLKTLAVGRYRVNFGMGLVINNDFNLGKLATLSTLGQRTNSIRGHSSRMESNYLQGVAATVTVATGLDVSAFVSYRNIDATLNSDGETIATLLKTGYHRTESELLRKNNAAEFVAGANVNFSRSGFRVGATAVYNSYDRELRPNTSQIYRYHYPAGKHFYNIGIDYGYRHHRFAFRGETATGGCGAIASLNTLSFRLSGDIELMAIHRFYSYKYYALHAESFSEGGSVQNENGVYLGVTWRPNRNFRLFAYSDFAYFAWPRYQADEASRSWENLIQMSYEKGNWAFFGRYRYKMREKNNEAKTGLIDQTTHRGRLSADYDGGIWTAKTQGDIAYSTYKKNSFGWMVTQNLSCKPLAWIDVNASLGYFHTDDYDSRLYTYERGMLYTFNFPAFYGEGIRYALRVRADISKEWMVMARLAVTDYFDRDHISSGLQQINRSSMSDLELQLRWKF